ncbi:hypothetical protein AYI68_g4418, partial [Smittium mucronatum]
MMFFRYAPVPLE